MKAVDEVADIEPMASGAVKASRDGFVRSVMVLSSGTAFAHILQAASLPILTRIYSPANFQTAAVFQSLLFILAIAACLRFDTAVSLAKDTTTVLRLVVLSLLSCVMTAAAMTILLLVIPNNVLLLIGDPSSVRYFWLLPIGIVLIGFISTFQSWHIREKSFKTLSLGKITQTISLVATQIGMGVASIAPFGLIFGNLFQLFFGTAILGRRVLASMMSDDVAAVFNRRYLWKTAVENYRFPLYSTWESLANVASIQLPLVIIGRFAIGPEAGYLLLAMTLMQAPLAILGTAIGQVFLSRAADHYHSGTLGNFTADTIRSLALIGLLPLLGIGILSPIAIGFVFGAEWSRSGWLILWMTPWFFMQFLASPTSMVLHVTGHQRDALILQVIGLVIRVAPVLVACIFNRSFVSEVYAISGFIFYTIYLFRILNSTGFVLGDATRRSSKSQISVIHNLNKRS
ncbi:MAG: oligosaccharide flippase family protein [Planctomycetota bacterium]|jgi:O-antigen/teichoic acid export membrane protein|nr:oligosaccharide flippase family protein [Planctomycetota bacterium]